jgi:hypothetical protein
LWGCRTVIYGPENGFMKSYDSGGYSDTKFLRINNSFGRVLPLPATSTLYNAGASFMYIKVPKLTFNVNISVSQTNKAGNWKIRALKTSTPSTTSFRRSLYFRPRVADEINVILLCVTWWAL